MPIASGERKTALPDAWRGEPRRAGRRAEYAKAWWLFGYSMAAARYLKTIARPVRQMDY